MSVGANLPHFQSWKGQAAFLFLKTYGPDSRQTSFRFYISFRVRLRDVEARYSTIELECLAIIESLKRIRHYLIGRHFEILTDHKPLEWFSSQKSVGKLWRWALIIQEFDFEINYRPGNKNHNADALSRLVNHGSNYGSSVDNSTTHNSEDIVYRD